MTASITNIAKKSGQIDFVSSSGDTYLMGTAADETLVTNRQDSLTNKSKS